jgi:hypothetical protein
MRRRIPLTNLNPRDNRAPVPSGAGMGPAAASHPDLPSPVSRAEEEAKARIWEPVEINLDQFMTPGTDTEAAPLVKRRGWPKGKKRGSRHEN